MEAIVTTVESLLPTAASKQVQQFLVSSFGVDPFVAQLVLVGLVIITTVVLAVVVSSIVSGSSKRSTGNALLLMGPCDSGKTALFYKLRGGKVPETVTSMEVNDMIFSFHKDSEVQCNKAVNVIDLPGHGRLRSSIGPNLRRAKVVLFLVNSCNLEESKSITDCAELLYEIFVQCYKEECRPDILVACNKSDLKGALSPEKVKAVLEKEIDKLKETRNAITMEGAEGEEEVMIGADGQKFEFEVDAPCQVSFCASSVAENKLSEVNAFIQHAFSSSV